MRTPAARRQATVMRCLGRAEPDRPCSGCSGPTMPGRPGLHRRPPECVEQRQVTLKSMIADKDRKWVKEPATPQAHASGVRLFAFRSRKKELSCEELAHGRREADGVPKALKGPDGRACHRRRFRAPTCSPPRSARSWPPKWAAPLQGVGRARARPPCHARRRSGSARCAQTGRWSGPTAGPVPAAVTADRATPKMWSSATCGRASGQAGQVGISVLAGASPATRRSVR